MRGLFLDFHNIAQVNELIISFVCNDIFNNFLISITPHYEKLSL